MDRSGEGSTSSSPNVKPFHRVFFRGRPHSPNKKVSGVRKLRSSFQHSQDTSSSAFSMLTFHNRSQWSSSQESSANELAWLSINGLFVNGYESTSSRIIGSLDKVEAAVWDSVAPLLVAITAAAATAAKQQYSKELERLHLAIDSRDKEFKSMRKRIECLQEHLSFWKEHAQPLCGDVECVEANGRLKSDSLSPHFKLEVDSTPKCESRILEQYATHLMEGLKGRPGSTRALVGEGLSRVTLENASRNGEFLEHLAEYTSYADKSSAFCTPQLPRALLNNCLTPGLPFAIPNKQQDCQYHLGHQKGHARVNSGSECTVPCTTARSLMEV